MQLRINDYTYSINKTNAENAFCFNSKNTWIENSLLVATVAFFLFGFFAYFYVKTVSLSNAIYLGCGEWGAATMAATIEFILKSVKCFLKQKLMSLNKTLKEQIEITPPYTRDDYEVSFSAYQPLDRLFENVFLGTIRSFYSIDPEYRRKHELIDPSVKGVRGIDHQGASNKNIKLVISITTHKASHEELNFEPKLPGIKHRTLQLEDEQGAWKTIDHDELESLFVDIDVARSKNESVLIHCTQGISRSPAFACAYLMRSCHVTPSQAYNFIRSKRPIVEDENFLEDLIQWHECFCKFNAAHRKHYVCGPSSFH